MANAALAYLGHGRNTAVAALCISCFDITAGEYLRCRQSKKGRAKGAQSRTCTLNLVNFGPQSTKNRTYSQSAIQSINQSELVQG